MEYSQHFTFHNSQVEGTLEIEYPASRSISSQYISGKLTLDSSSVEANQTLRFTAKHGVVVSPGIIEIENQQHSEPLKFYVPNDVSELSVGMVCSSAGELESEGRRIEFEDLTLLSFGSELFREETFDADEYKRQISRYKGSDGGIWPLINFAGQVSRYTTLERYVAMLERLAEEYAEDTYRLNTVLETILKRMLLGEIGDGRHHIQRLSEFESAVDKLSSIHHAADPNPDNAISYALQQLDEYGDLDELIRVVHELRVVDSYPNILNDKLVYILIAEEILRRSESGVRNIVKKYFDPVDPEEFDPETYDEIKSKALDASDPERALEQWYHLLEYAGLPPNSSEFKFIIANLLWEVGDAKRGKSEFYYVSPHFYKAAATWYPNQSIEAQRCWYEYHYRQGLYLFHQSDFEACIEHFSSAIQIASNESGEYEKPQHGWLDFPIIYHSLAQGRKLTEKDERKEAAELLKEQREILKDLQSVSEDALQRIISAIGGERLRILSDIHLEEDEYERAEKSLGKAIGLFIEGDLQRSAQSSINKQREINAVLNEVAGDFATAANAHERLAKDESYSDGKQALHAVRADICRAKAKTKARDFDGAIDNLKKVNRRTEGLKGDARDLGILLRLLDSYSRGEVRSAAQALEKLSQKRGRQSSQHPLNVEYDYTEPIVVVLALQRLRQTHLPQDLLESIIDISVRRALTPDHSDAKVDETYLSDISIERLWRERLPSIVLSRVEEIQLDSATVTGNRKGVTLLLAELLEIYLALLVEYHAKCYWGGDWQSELITEDESEDKLSIGILARIFHSKASDDIDNSERLHQIYFNSTEGFDNMTVMRNQFDHGYEGHVDQNEFRNLRDWVFEFLEASVQDAPLIGSIEDKNQFGLYSIRLHWWRGFRQIILDADTDLEIGSYYYLPTDPIIGSNNRVIQSISDEEIIAVDDERVIEQLNELSGGAT